MLMGSEEEKPDLPEERSEDAEEAQEDAGPRPGVTRRRFLKYAVVGGAVAAAAGLGAYVWLSPRRSPGLPAYFVTPTSVDYSKVPETIESPTLHVAQWYQYWPSSFLDGFKAHIQQKYGVSINIIQEIYTSNEELFTWITQLGKKFDVIFPTNYEVETMERAGLLLNMNPDWLPNYANLFSWVQYTQPANSYARRSPSGHLLAVPYQWGTSGIGFRTDRGFTRDDLELDGYDVFWQQTYHGAPLVGKLMMMDDVRFTFGQTFKKLGWDEQAAKGYTPTAVTANPAAPYNGEYQWSQNETDGTRIQQARDALISIKPNLFDFNTQNQGPYLVQDIVWIDTAWSGDIMYAIRPNTPSPQPIDYLVPRQGTSRWIDNAVLHRESRNLFLAHEFIDYFLDPQVGATITDWNLYATPNAASFDLLRSYPEYGWDPREDPRIYSDLATGYTGAPILERCDYIKDLGADLTKTYLDAWSLVKFG